MVRIDAIFAEGVVCSLTTCNEPIENSVAALFPDARATHAYCAEKYSDIHGFSGPAEYITFGMVGYGKPKLPGGWRTF